MNPQMILEYDYHSVAVLIKVSSVYTETNGAFQYE